ncbi:DNA/RNA polymerase [Wallemia mellicola]|nr:DNA/RNA polymerase [Wallemia mellicola]
MTIISIDFDAFYVACHRSRDKTLLNIPFAVQQKHILCTVSYEARARGVKKLSSLSDARRICPEIRTVNGEDLTLYRTISRDVFAFLVDYLGADTPIQKLGLDEFFIDISNLPGQPRESSQTHLVYQDNELTEDQLNDIAITADIRRQIYNRFKLTSSAGISNSIILSKLVGNLHKPDQQTFLNANSETELQNLLDAFHLRKIHGFGRVVVERIQKLTGLSDDETTVYNTRNRLREDALINEFGEKLGTKLYKNLHGVDDEQVRQSSVYPKQISIEDSSGNIDTIDDAYKMLHSVTQRLVKRLDEEYLNIDKNGRKYFVMHPTKMRISTRRLSSIPNTRIASHFPESASCDIGVALFQIERNTVAERASRLCRDYLETSLTRLYRAGIAAGANKLRVVNVAFTDFVEGQPMKPIDDFMRGRKEIINLSSDSESENEGHISENNDDEIRCPTCNAQLMPFTVESHLRFHELGD